MRIGDNLVLGTDAIIGIVLIVVAAFFRNRAINGIRAWRSMRNVRGPTLGTDPPATITVRAGFLGGITWILASLFGWLCFFVGLDFVFLSAQISRYLFSMLPNLGTAVENLRSMLTG